MKDGQTLGSYDYKEDQFIVMMVKKAKAAAAAPAAAAPAAAAPAAPAAAAAAPKEEEKPKEIDTPAAAPSPPAAPVPAAPEPASAPSAAQEDAMAGMAQGQEFDSQIAMIMDMGFAEDQVKIAMRAAFNNAERAVEYLMDPSSMPAVEAPQAAAPGGAVPANPAAGVPANPAAGIPANPAAAGGEAPADPVAAATAAGVPAELAALLQDPQFMQMIAALQQNPQMLPAVLAEIQKSNPQLMQTIVQNQGAFMQLLGGAGGGAGGGPGGAGAGGPPPGSIQITQEEKEALERMEQLFPGLDRGVIYQAYKACDSNEELTVNLLMDNPQSFMMDEGQ